jgi:hypothetical protein
LPHLYIRRCPGDRACSGGSGQSPQGLYDFDHGRIGYTTSPTSDPITRIQKRIDSGDLKLKFDKEHGYLPALLEELQIPRSSQTLVFSKSSLQLFLIAPDNPRAIYFNDDVYVGSVQASPILEIASMDPKLGALFYTLPQKDAEKTSVSKRILACLLCHDTPTTNEVPGLMTLSVLTDRDGNVIPAAGTAAMSDRTPFKERFGGWYVTGTHGAQQHWGNLTASANKESIGDAKAYVRRLNLSQGANVLDLTPRFNTKPYLTPNSDIAALMVMTHQTRLHNVMTRTRFDVEFAGDDAEKIRIAVEPLVRNMFFVWKQALSAGSGQHDICQRFCSDRPTRSQRAVAARPGSEQETPSVSLELPRVLAAVRQPAGTGAATIFQTGE